MTQEQLQALIDAGDIKKIKETFDTLNAAYLLDESIKQFDLAAHDVMNETIRKKKTINGEDGAVSTIEVSRLPIPVQKKIVLLASAFLGVPKVKATPADDKQKDMLTIIEKVLEDNKFDYKFRTCVKKTKSEKQCAILCYTEELKGDSEYWKGYPINERTKFKIRMKILAPSLGDTLYPVFDTTGDMIAFGRFYEATAKVDGKDVKYQYFDMYTDEKIYYSVKEGDADWFTEAYANIIKKIPVIYFTQPLTEWQDVQRLISRLEIKTSNHADTNDYYDSPIVFAEGEVEGFSNKGEQGKVLEGKNGAKVSYLTWDSAPESMKMEMENLQKWIHSYSHTPDISFESMKGLGQFSGIALKMLFMDAHLKAYDSEEIFGEGAQRLFNYLKAAIAVIATEFSKAVTVQIKPEFNYFLPKNVTEELSNITTAVNAGILSIESAVKLNPLVQDAENELELIKAEKANKKEEPAIPL